MRSEREDGLVSDYAPLLTADAVRQFAEMVYADGYRQALDEAVRAVEKERIGTNENDNPTDIAYDNAIADALTALRALKGTAPG